MEICYNSLKNTINLEDNNMRFQLTFSTGALAVYGAELMVYPCLHFPYGKIYFCLNPNGSFVEILLLYRRYDTIAWKDTEM